MNQKRPTNAKAPEPLPDYQCKEDSATEKQVEERTDQIPMSWLSEYIQLWKRLHWQMESVCGSAHQRLFPESGA